MIWTCKLSKQAEQQISRLPRNVQKKVARAIDLMEEDPLRGDVRPLKEKKWKGRYRKVVGNYRLVFVLNHQKRIVEISAVLLRTEKTYK